MATYDSDARKGSWRQTAVVKGLQCLTHLKLSLMCSWQNFFVSEYFSWIKLIEKRETFQAMLEKEKGPQGIEGSKHQQESFPS